MPGATALEISRLLRLTLRTDAIGRAPERKLFGTEMHGLATALFGGWHVLLRSLPTSLHARRIAQGIQGASAWTRTCHAIAHIAKVAAHWQLLLQLTRFARSCRRGDPQLATLELIALRGLGRHAEVVQVGDVIRTRFPHHAPLVREFADSLRRCGQSLRAAALLYAIADHSDHPAPLVDLARVQRARGLRSSALRYYRAALARHRPEHHRERWLTHLELARLLLEDDQPEEAARETLLARTTRLDAGWPDAQPVDEFLSDHEHALCPAIPRLRKLSHDALLGTAQAGYLDADRELRGRAGNEADTSDERVG